MFCLAFVLIVRWLPLFAAAVMEHQSPLGNTSTKHNHADVHIAIIGAGIGGASAALNTYDLNYPSSSRAVTIYEREARVGGRIETIHPATDFVPNPIE